MSKAAEAAAEAKATADKVSKAYNAVFTAKMLRGVVKLLRSEHSGRDYVGTQITVLDGVIDKELEDAFEALEWTPRS